MSFALEPGLSWRCLRSDTCHLWILLILRSWCDFGLVLGPCPWHRPLSTLQLRSDLSLPRFAHH